MLCTTPPSGIRDAALARRMICEHAAAAYLALLDAPPLPRAETLEWLTMQYDPAGDCPDFCLEELIEQLGSLGLWNNVEVA